MAKKSINLSKLIKQYDIKDDVTNPNQYGFGSWLKDNAVPLLQTGAAIAGTVATGGAAAPMFLPMGTQGLTGLAANNLAEDPQDKAMIQGTGAIAGQIGGMAASGAFDSQMAQGGKLTQYNGGGTHEENPRGGIDIGPNAQVEDKETRWEDYIFSDRIKIPGKNYTFAEASKKIDAKYKRDNDNFEDRAKEIEMKRLIAMHEAEKEKVQATQQAEFQKAFGGNMNQFPDGGNMTFITDPSQLAQRNIEAEQLRVSQIQDAANATGDDYMNPAQRNAAIKDKYGKMSFSDTILNDLNNSAQADTPPTSIGTTENGSNTDLASKIKSNNYTNSSTTSNALTEAQRLANMQNVDITPFTQTENARRLAGNAVPNEIFGEYTPTYSEDGTKVIYDPKNPIYQEKVNRTGEIDDFRQYLAKELTSLGVKLPMTERGLIDATKLDPNFTVPKEVLAKLDQDKLNRYYDNLEWKNQLRRHEGWQTKNYYGDKEAESRGYTSSTPLRELNFGPRFLTGVQNQNFNQVGSQKAYGGKIQYAYGTELEEMPLPEDVSLSEALALDPNNKNKKSNKEFDWGKAAMFGAQNIGNLYNIGKGLQGAEQVDLGQINPQKYDYSKAIKSAEDKYASAANIARESIRKGSTSSGQSLSNMIAANTSLTQGQERAIRDIMQQQDNQNTGLANQAEQYNLGLRNQESQINSQNEAMKDQFIAQGLSGIGSNIAQYNRDNKADKMQQGYIENLLKTGKYEIDPVTGRIRLIGSENV